MEIDSTFSRVSREVTCRYGHYRSILWNHEMFDELFEHASVSILRVDPHLDTFHASKQRKSTVIDPYRFRSSGNPQKYYPCYVV